MQFFFQKKNKNDGELLSQIERVCEGLVYISETDAPVLPFAGTTTASVTREIILGQTGRDEPVDESTFESFFGRLTAIQDWFGAPQKARAEKFLELQKLLEQNLRHRKVFRVGKIRVRIFAVGIDKDDRLMGVTADAVET